MGLLGSGCSGEFVATHSSKPKEEGYIQLHKFTHQDLVSVPHAFMLGAVGQESTNLEFYFRYVRQLLGQLVD